MDGLGFPIAPHIRRHEHADEDAGDVDDDGAAEIDVSTGQLRRELAAHDVDHPDCSIPGAIQDYLHASASLRRGMGLPDGNDGQPQSEARLLLVQPDKMMPTANGFICPARTLRRGVAAFATRFHVRIAAEHPGVSRLNVGLKAIRVSAINQFRRSSGSMDATVAMAQHASPSQTAHYLRNRDIMALNSEETRRIVIALEHAVRTRTLVLVAPDRTPAEAEDIGHGLACRSRANSAMPGQSQGHPCDFFLGCLSCERGIVIATALNCARLVRYREHLVSSQVRRAENRDRWDRWIAPSYPCSTKLSPISRLKSPRRQ